MNDAGQVRGISYRYDGGSTWLGQSAWLYNGATTIDIGLTGTQYTRNDGFKLSETNALNTTGQVLGNSARYDSANSEPGRTAWIYDGGTTIGIGLTDSTHTAPNGLKVSGGSQLNEAGQVIGLSARFDVLNPELGGSQSAWIFDGANTIHIGLTDSEHTHSGTNLKYSDVYGLNQAGHAIGISERYDGLSPGSDRGRSAWIYDGANTIKIGLTGPGYTSVDGHKISEPWGLNEAGYVMGISRPCSGGFCVGSSAWIYNGTTTIEIGRAGPEHDGISEPIEMNLAGQVRGTTTLSAGFGGSSAWLYNGTTTIDIGLKGAQHTRNDGYKNSYFGNLYDQLNEAGQVIGVSQRFNGGEHRIGSRCLALRRGARSNFLVATLPAKRWLCLQQRRVFGRRRPGAGNLHAVRRARTTISATAPFTSPSPMACTIWGRSVEGGLAANGWDFLATAIRANGLGQILGHGKLSSQSYRPNGLPAHTDRSARRFQPRRHRRRRRLRRLAEESRRHLHTRRLQHLAHNFGQTFSFTGSGSGAATSAAPQFPTIPEPATLAMLTYVAACWCLQRRRVCLKVPITHPA